MWERATKFRHIEEICKWQIKSFVQQTPPLHQIVYQNIVVFKVAMGLRVRAKKFYIIAVRSSAWLLKMMSRVLTM